MILRNPLKMKIYLYPKQIDMRMSWNGLFGLVTEEMKMNVYDRSLFVFCGRSNHLIKILYWDGNGFCIWMKRLEKGNYPFQSRGRLSISKKELLWLLSGIDTRRQHKELKILL